MAKLVHADDGVLLEHRRHVITLDLDHSRNTRSFRLGFAVLGWRLIRNGPVLQLLLGAITDAARALPGTHHLSFQPIDQVIERGRHGRAGADGADHRPVVHQAHLRHVRGLRGTGRVDDQLNGGIGIRVRDPLEAMQLAVDLGAQRIGQLEVARVHGGPHPGSSVAITLR